MKTIKQLYHWLGWSTQGDLGPFTFYTNKRKGLVWFPRSPPKCPPSQLQVRQRNAFRLAAEVWDQIPTEHRRKWDQAARRAHLSITGYDLFIYWCTTNDTPAVNTVEHQSQLTLLPLEYSP